ncbi:flavin-containing monooxygenase 5-like isoform X2 [Synchiropus splendidus]|uniref:flavin-containing monooxygenase 5-like isoform X2 n=1 Tax=Synchiropus splendidus TaxID=270530 RepID=UPI00237E25D7|nr:flavin-containing monooxygenase 5-like isoform X2 [Synchiropus splendidus]
MVRRVAVVGAGCSGLACVKICVEEGLEPVCFESTDDIGGLWRFKDSREKEQPSIYRSLVTNTSKEMMCFSDFPMPDHFPNYLHNTQVLHYLRLFVQHFHLLKYFQFQTRVKNVVPRPDFSESGQWEVVTTSSSGEETRHIFDGVLVCSGQYNRPAVPLTDFTGYATFAGQCLHSWEYKDAEAFRGKRVVIVGIGNSGGDIAVEVSRVASKTFLSTRKGVWVMGRTLTRGLPVDLTSITRLNNILTNLPVRSLVNSWIEGKLNHTFDHGLYGLKPAYRFMDRKPLINDDLPGRILQGALVVKPNVKEFNGSAVLFEDGSEEKDVDAVVFCTGYRAAYRFLPVSLTDGPAHELQLYRKMFFPALHPPTLAVMGLFHVNGPNMPIMELQARWAVKVFTGLSRLPSKDEMLAVIARDKSMYTSYPDCEASLRVEYIPYMDFLAGEIGVRPNLLRLVLTDPTLWLKVFFGPCTPFQYRLCGPGRWAGARQAILTQWHRVAEPFRGGVRLEPEETQGFHVTPWLLRIGVLLIVAHVLSKHKSILMLQVRLTQCLDQLRGVA